MDIQKFLLKKILAIIVIVCSTFTTSLGQGNQVEIDRNRFLLLDSRIVLKAKNAALALGTIKKNKRNPLFVEDQPWEKRLDNVYANVIYDEDEKIFKCWYSPFIVWPSAKGMTLEERKKTKYVPPPKGKKEMALCYAVSEDGIKWRKPKLGIVEYEGSKENNIVWRTIHGPGVFKDHNETDPQKRYKLFSKAKTGFPNPMQVAYSSDGIHWGEPILCPEIDAPGDTHNNAFWAPTLGKYVAITREHDNGRLVARTESRDFENWSKAQIVLEGFSKNAQTYSMPVFYYGGIYMGLVTIYNPESSHVWTELTWSPDTKKWHRILPGTPFIPNSEVNMAYDWGCVYAAAYPVFLEDEIRLYYGGSDGAHSGWRVGSLNLATLRPDGFAGYEQVSVDEPAIIITSPIAYSGQPLQITADVEIGGSVEVSIIDKNWEDIATAQTISNTVSDAPLNFNEKVEEEKIRLKFKFIKAKIYSFSLAD